MKIALAQINPTVGDIPGNIRRIESWAARAARRHADLVLFPELCVTGYPPRDLLDHTRFVERNRAAVQDLARRMRDIAALVGFVDYNLKRTGNRLCNAAALIADGTIVAVRHKQLLPSYDVFDETRHFAPGKADGPVPFGRHRLAVTICEDMWNDARFWPRRTYASDPVQRLAKAGADLFFNISSSPFHRRKTGLRLNIIRSHVRQIRRPFFFVNQVGGNDELIFDGQSLAIDAHGRMLAQAKSFAEDLVIVDSGTAGTKTWHEDSDIHQVRDALILGLRDYVRKCSFSKVVLGLSGGIDSAVTAALAVEALGRDHVMGVSMPSPFSSAGSVIDSQKLSKALGIKMLSLPISSIFSMFKNTLRPAFCGRPSDVTEENLQARIRGSLLMALSNKFGALLLTTGNKSELSMGYCTLYGDMNGGLAVISDVPKMMVYQLGRLLNKRRPVIPEACFTKPPSAELRPNQTDQDSLPPYPVLDAIIEAYVEEGKDVEEIASEGYARALVERVLSTIDRNEYKRRQAAPGLRITPKAFGIGRRMPIARGDFRSEA
ncbi:MAG TPA: NAD+ synthase [Elusimicrobiota bacterium]|nr:NAD+ synthase [Elusimicrobiota bacterium]